MSVDEDYTADQLRAFATEIARLVNDEGMNEYDAVEAVGLTEDDVCSENSEAFSLDEDDNDCIDFYGWPAIDDTNCVHIMLRRGGRRGAKTPWALAELKMSIAAQRAM
jgi:hypothetical protein